jgi:hypothetical protein
MELAGSGALDTAVGYYGRRAKLISSTSCRSTLYPLNGETELLKYPNSGEYALAVRETDRAQFYSW